MGAFLRGLFCNRAVLARQAKQGQLGTVVLRE